MREYDGNHVSATAGDIESDRVTTGDVNTLAKGGRPALGWYLDTWRNLARLLFRGFIRPQNLAKKPAQPSQLAPPRHYSLVPCFTSPVGSTSSNCDWLAWRTEQED